MNAFLPHPEVSTFMTSHLPDLFERYGMNFCIDGPQLEYFVYQKKTGLDISCSLTVNLDDDAGKINVMTFYPGLSLLPGSRYLSAVCFFIVMQHFANFHQIKRVCRICLHSKKAIFDSFYALLQDFNFHLQKSGEKDRVDVESFFRSSNIDTSMVIERALVDY
ncbi:hypothetical protein [Desulfoluna sp.]|uniref:hypothetical protein n=1 Tax=Desulfoluna sp. TaxID=2045199 RepID=UPI00261BD1CB|nr:hypothetical protein [Desulfoluna sp.]